MIDGLLCRKLSKFSLETRRVENLISQRTINKANIKNIFDGAVKLKWLSLNIWSKNCLMFHVFISKQNKKFSPMCSTTQLENVEKFENEPQFIFQMDISKSLIVTNSAKTKYHWICISRANDRSDKMLCLTQSRNREINFRTADFRKKEKKGQERFLFREI